MHTQTPTHTHTPKQEMRRWYYRGAPYTKAHTHTHIHTHTQADLEPVKLVLGLAADCMPSVCVCVCVCECVRVCVWSRRVWGGRGVTNKSASKVFKSKDDGVAVLQCDGCGVTVYQQKRQFPA
jgi:hypothetical protein